MTPKKWIVLAIYLVLAAIALAMPGTQAAQVIAWIFVVLVVAHLLEIAVVWRLLNTAPGSLAHHLLHTLLFGYVHWLPIKQQSN